MGLDGECAEAFTQYKQYGDWIQCLDPRILGNGCGNLVCQIATDLSKQCYALQDVGDMTTTHFIQVKDYTPCGGSINMYCLSGSCVPKPSNDATCPNDCSQRGMCSNDGTCRCDYGWTSDDCSVVQTCQQNCKSLGREGCVSDALCGPCIEDRGSLDINDETTPCIFLAPEIMRVNASSAIDSTTAMAAFDHQPYIHWKADFSTGVAWIMVNYGEPMTIVHYEIQSPNTLPQFDPRSWSFQGGHGDGTPWVTLDTQLDIIFEDRHLIKPYHISTSNQAAFPMYRFYFTAVRDDNGGQLQLAEIKLYKDDHNAVADGTTTKISAASAVAQLSVSISIVGALLYLL
jgi:hypothetical protein